MLTVQQARTKQTEHFRTVKFLKLSRKNGPRSKRETRVPTVHSYSRFARPESTANHRARPGGPGQTKSCSSQNQTRRNGQDTGHVSAANREITIRRRRRRSSVGPAST